MTEAPVGTIGEMVPMSDWDIIFSRLWRMSATVADKDRKLRRLGAQAARILVCLLAGLTTALRSDNIMTMTHGANYVHEYEERHHDFVDELGRPRIFKVLLNKQLPRQRNSFIYYVVHLGEVISKRCSSVLCSHCPMYPTYPVLCVQLAHSCSKIVGMTGMVRCVTICTNV